MTNFVRLSVKSDLAVSGVAGHAVIARITSPTPMLV